MSSNENLKAALDHLIAFSIFCVPVALLTILAIWKRFSWIARVRFPAIIPYAIAGALSTKLFNPIREGRWSPDVNGTLRAIFGTASVGQVFAASWTVIAWFFLIILKNKSDASAHEVLGRKKSTGYFYVLLVDLAIFACLVGSVAVSSASFPWLFSSCSDDEYTASRVVLGVRRAAEDSTMDAACRRGVMIQVMSMSSAVLIVLQDILIFPLVNLPRTLRFIIFFTIRLIQRPPLRRGDLERGEGVSGKSSTTPPEEEVTGLLAKHPHYSDLLAALQESNGVVSSEYIEILAEKCCGESNMKSQCWACDGVICEGCKTQRSSVPLPRTTGHVIDCYAICTPCYLVKGTSQPAKFSATLNPTDLSLQHHGCSKNAPAVAVREVELCLGCSKRTSEQNSADREEREQRMLTKALLRRILCSKCQRPIRKENRRWWICRTGDHECHWSGHEAGRY